MRRTCKLFGFVIVASLTLVGVRRASADAVTDWNAIMQATVSAPPSTSLQQSRWASTVKRAVFSAAYPVDGHCERYLRTTVAPPAASPGAAAIAAAHRTLVTLRPGDAPSLTPLRNPSLAALSPT